MPASYIAARALYQTGGALLAAGLVASSSVLIEYSTNARGYSLVCLIFVALISLAAYAVRTQNWTAWFCLAIVSALGLYTIPIMLYPFGGIVIWLLLCMVIGDARFNSWGSVTGLISAVGLTVFVTTELYSPVLAVSGPKALFANKWVAASPLHIFLRGLPVSLASTWQGWNRGVPSIVAMALAAAFFVSLLRHRRCSKFPVPIVLALILWVLPVISIQRVVPFERVWLFALPLYFIASAAGVATVTAPLDRFRLRQAVILVGIAVSLVLGIRALLSNSIYLSNEGRDLDSLALYLKGRLAPGDSVVVVPPSDGPMLYYFQKEGVPSSYLNAEKPDRKLLVVNEVSGDTVQKLLSVTRAADQGGPFPSASRQIRFGTPLRGGAPHQTALRNR